MPASDCWLWPRGHNGAGYGVTADNQLAHRRAYEAYRGEIPEGMLVCHTCDTRLCVNPFHLFLGTHKDNTKDMIDKGRAANGSCKITEADVRSIRAKVNGGRSQITVAEEYGLSRSQVSKIVTGLRWKGVR